MRNILIVEDDEPVVDLLEDILCSVPDWAVTIAYDATMALEAVERARPDLVLLDIQLYGIDGIQLYDTWKENPKTRDLPVLFITANGAKHRGKLEDRGIADYIVKPFKVDSVISQVASALHEARQPVSAH